MFDWLLGSGGKSYQSPSSAYLDAQREKGKAVEQALAGQTEAIQRGESAGNALLRQGMQQAVNEQASMAASARGGAMNLAGARNQAAVNAVSAQGQAANQAAMLKSQELAQALGAQSQYQQGAMGAEVGKYSADQQMAIAKANAEKERSGKVGQMIGSGLGAVASILSDERAKENIQPAPMSALEALMDAQNPSTYRYRGDGQERLGVIAQDLEDTELGRLLVQQGPDGLKRIDKDAALSALLAEVGALHERLNELGAKTATVGKGGR